MAANGRGRRANANAVTQPGTKLAALIVDDDEVFRMRLCRALTDRGWQALGAPDGESAIRLAEEHSPDLVVVDLRLPGAGGLDIIRTFAAWMRRPASSSSPDTAVSPQR